MNPYIYIPMRYSIHWSKRHNLNMGALPEPQLTEPLHVFTPHTIHLGQNSHDFVAIPVIIERRKHEELDPRGQVNPLPVEITGCCRCWRPRRSHRFPRGPRGRGRWRGRRGSLVGRISVCPGWGKRTGGEKQRRGLFFQLKRIKRFDKPTCIGYRVYFLIRTLDNTFIKV